MTNRPAYDVIIVGAGLSGLVAALTLQQRAPGIRLLILEARARAGGRILTAPTAVSGVRIDLGPTWVWPHQAHVQSLLHRLALSTFPQYTTGAALFDQGMGAPARRFHPDWEQEPAYRINGGMHLLIRRLLQELGPGLIAYGQVVRRIEENADGLLVTTGPETSYRARQVLVTLPPRLAATLDYEPPLPLPVVLAMQETQTWMGQAMKVGLVYEQPFWRAAGLSGLTVSYVGPVGQFHDASPPGEPAGALFGWLGNQSEARDLSRKERRQQVVAQATRIFGEQAMDLLDYVECNWRREPFTSRGEPIAEIEHPEYGSPLLRAAQLNGRLHWASTEVSPVGGGYLEGAVYIGEEIAARVAGA